MCRVLMIARAGFYFWLHKPLSDKAIEDTRLLKLIKTSYDASHGIYGANRVVLDLKELGEQCGRNRVARITRSLGI
jgi:putative transposase